MSLGLADTGVWISAEPYLDNANTANVLGMSVILTATWSARLVFQSWRQSRVPLRNGLPLERINHARASRLLEGGSIASASEPEMVGGLRAFYEATRLSFLAAASPRQFIQRSQQEWAAYHRALQPSILEQDLAPYPFKDLLGVIAAEAPELLLDVPVDLPSQQSSRQAELPSLCSVCRTAHTETATVPIEKVLLLAQEVMGGDELDADAPLMDAGLDSLAVTALRASLQAAIGSDVDVPYTLIFDAPTPRQIAAELISSTQKELAAGMQTHVDAGHSLTAAASMRSSSGWVLSQRESWVLAEGSNEVFTTFWYSFPVTLAGTTYYLLLTSK
jgi:aryl carrier-like protein